MSNTALLLVMLSLRSAPVPSEGETQSAYENRLLTIATAIVAATPIKSHQLAVVTLFWHESRFNAQVHSGARRDASGLAVCLGQHHQNWRVKSAWEALAGTDLAATTRCATETANVLRRALNLCRSVHGAGTVAGGWQGAFTVYGTGESCTKEWPGKHNAAARARTLNRLIRQY